jgi:hypothetical protein
MEGANFLLETLKDVALLFKMKSSSSRIKDRADIEALTMETEY